MRNTRAESTRREARKALPSQRRFSTHNLGVLLAIFSGLSVLAANTWPMGIVVGEGVRVPPWLLSIPIGIVFLLSPFWADSHPGAVKGILGVGSLALLGWGAFAILTWGTTAPFMAWALVILPSLLGFVAAWLIGPMEREAAP